jgi:bifunctional non-homologous end joining protein LigD
VAAYSTRAKTGAPVSVPLAWTELGPDRRPEDLQVGNVEARLDALSRDPWEEYFRARQRFTKEMAAALGRL